MESSARDPHPGSRPGRSRGGRRAWADRGRRVGARATFRLAAFAVALAGALVSVACEPADPLAEVRALHAAGRYEDSLAPLRELIDERPDDPEVLYLYGVALGGAGFRTQAVWPLRRAMEDEAWATPAAVQLANVAISTADWDMALGVLDPVLEREPDHPRALVLRAYARAQSRQNYEGALEDAEAVLAADPQSSDALVLRAVALLGLQRIEEAGEAIEAAAAHFDEAGLGLAQSPRFCVVRATFAKEKKELDRAEEIFEECLADAPVDFTVVDEAVKFFDAIGRPERSLEILQAAHEGAPASRSYRLSLAYRLSGMGEHDEAETVLRSATDAASAELAANAYADLAGYYFERERFDDAIAAFEAALERVPDPGAEFLFTYADVLVASGRYERALALADRMTVAPHRELIRGRVALEQGESEVALAHFTEGLRLWPDNAVARYFAATAAEAVGDYDRAIEEYRYSIRSDPQATDARLRLARLYVALGDIGSALQAVRHDAERKPARDHAHLLLELELLARLGRGEQLPVRLRTATRPRELWAPAVAALARGTRASRGPGAAAKVVLDADRLDLTDPRDAEALASLVDDLLALDRNEEARRRVAAAVAAHPETAVFHALRGRVAAESEMRSEAARRAYERALALDPDEPRALRGLARLAADQGHDGEAVAYFERAAAADAQDTTALREAVAVLEAAGRRAEAVGLLERAVERDPYEGALLLRLARLLVDESSPESRARAEALLHRAARLGERDDAERLLARLETGVPAAADEARPTTASE